MNFCFFVNVYDDWKAATRLIQCLRILYPDEDIICCSDGITIAGMLDFCSQQKVNCFRPDQRLKLSQFGGAWIERMIKIYAQSSAARYLIKIDPDCLVLRAFRRMPDAGLFGSIQRTGNSYGFNGGCMGLDRETAIHLLISGLLQDEKYKTASFSYGRYQPPYKAESEQSSPDLLIASDLILLDACIRLGIRHEDWSDVFSVATEAELNQAFPNQSFLNSYQFAVVHPVKQ